MRGGVEITGQSEKTHRPIIITEHGRPTAQLMPGPARSRSLFGYMKGTVKLTGDTMSSMESAWSALSGDEDHLFEPPPRSAKRALGEIMSGALLNAKTAHSLTEQPSMHTEAEEAEQERQLREEYERLLRQLDRKPSAQEPELEQQSQRAADRCSTKVRS